MADEEEEYDSRSIARAQSAHILSRKNEERDQMKARMLSKQKDFRRKVDNQRKQKVNEWQKKMKRSPFRVDLLAENERIDEVRSSFCSIVRNLELYTPRYY